MEKHIVKVLETNYVTHDVRRMIVEKPAGYNYVSGQATDVSLNLPGWTEKLSSFTFTSLNDWEFLEFMTKIYPDRLSVTDKLRQIETGSELILHEVFGTIHYQGPGVFFAGGAGVTPFVSILRGLYRDNNIQNIKLYFSNKTTEDVILEDEFRKMLNENFVSVITRTVGSGHKEQRINKAYLEKHITDFSQNFYICGPDAFVEDIKSWLVELGVSEENLVYEK